MAELKTTVILVMSYMMSSDSSPISGCPVSIFRKEARLFGFFGSSDRQTLANPSTLVGTAAKSGWPACQTPAPPGGTPTALTARIFVIPASTLNFYTTGTFGPVDKSPKDQRSPFLLTKGQHSCGQFANYPSWPLSWRRQSPAPWPRTKCPGSRTLRPPSNLPPAQTAWC